MSVAFTYLLPRNSLIFTKAKLLKRSALKHCYQSELARPPLH